MKEEVFKNRRVMYRFKFLVFIGVCCHTVESFSVARNHVAKISFHHSRRHHRSVITEEQLLLEHRKNSNFPTRRSSLSASPSSDLPSTKDDDEDVDDSSETDATKGSVDQHTAETASLSNELSIQSDSTPTSNEVRNGEEGNADDEQSSSSSLSSSEITRKWPCGDDMDRTLIQNSIPLIANFAIVPLIGAVDLFWVNRMGDALAVAGQAAANQVFSSAFWITSFLPTITATLVAKKHASGDKEGKQDAVCQAMVVGVLIATLASTAMYLNPERALSLVYKGGAPALKFAKPYLLIRSMAFLPSLISLVGFSAFRGILDTKTPVKISAFANIFNCVLDPVLIFTLRMGVPGAALATVAAEVISAVVYMKLLFKRKLVRWSKLFKLPEWASLAPLLKGGLALQLRNVALNLTFIMVTRTTQAIDKTGVAAAAHAMAIQTFQLGGVVLLALSTVAQTVVPNAMVERYDEEQNRTVGGIKYAKSVVSRLMRWGVVLGILLGALQVLLIPTIQKSTPLLEVRKAALAPSLIASAMHIINGLVFIGEGVMVGTGNFFQLSLNTVTATAAFLASLAYFPNKFGLTGVWIGFIVFNMVRLGGVWIYQKKNGPFAKAQMESKS